MDDSSKHESRATVMLVATIVTTVTAIVLTLLRLYVRIFLIKLLDRDDIFNVLGMLAEVVVMALIVVAVQNGFGQHIADLDPAKAAYGMEMLRIGEFTLIMSTVFVKIAICLFLMRLFVRSKAWTTFLWAFIAFNTITSVLDASFIFPQCTPVEYNWNKTIEGKCWSNAAINGIGIMQGSIAAFTDFTLATLPIYFLWEIQIVWRVKIGICAIMALGYASGGFAIARTILVPSLTTTHDPTWDLVPLFMWAVLESNFGVIAAAAPSVRPLLGGNALTTSNSKSKSRQAPLKGASGSALNTSWLHLGGSSQANALHHNKDEGGTGDEIKMLPYNNHDIIRTTNVSVRSESWQSGRLQRSRNSSDESLVPGATYFVNKD